MDEIGAVMEKYTREYVQAGLTAEAADLRDFAATFYSDVAEVFDVLTRIKNVQRNPSGFSTTDAPVLGLLVRMWKLLKQIVTHYRENNAQMINVLDRVFVEVAVTAQYLMDGDEGRVEDYRKCSYRHRLRLLAEHEAGSAFFDTKAGMRLLGSIQDKMRFEGLTEADFEAQRKNRWRIDGKSFYKIFRELHGEDRYAMTYGIMSESIHGSWNDSWDFDLVHHPDGTFTAFPFFQPADPRYVGPLIVYGVPAFRAWLKRIDAFEEPIERLLSLVEALNGRIFLRFDDVFDGP